ncbi:peptidase S41 [Chitinophaga cymbidii]|uniref:Peptidase S41 n=2 Tax=Chitinophaga cymbidii TaxID=1096750 RepID=A0A512RHF4_9BACT|nr:peptidase S41 [Chitinophaga cymbidii]
MLFLCVSAGLVFSSCKKKDADGPDRTNTNKYVNDWIYANMKDYYYWTSSIPANPDRTTDPESFFYGLLKSPDDQFSWIQNNFQELLASLSGVQKEAGYGYTLFLHEQGTLLGAQVTYVKRGSPAETAGLKRGDMFFQINGRDFPYSAASGSQNVNAFVSALGENHTIAAQQYFLTAGGEDSLGAERNLTLNTIVFAENPVYLDSVYSIEGKKIGYFMYNFFAPDKGDSTSAYDNEVDAVFSRFKAQGVTDLILDLRYNPGGDQVSTINLGSQIVKNYTANKLFFRREYNSLLTQEFTEDYGEEFFKMNFTPEAGNIGNTLQNFIILTSTETASASELIINGLKPYMPVYIIGDTTAGKNVGSTTIYEENDLRNKWGMQPIITKAFNSQNQSDYGLTGFSPDQRFFESFNLGVLGDTKEPLLNLALKKIVGAQWGRMAPAVQSSRTKVEKVGSSNMSRAFYQKMFERLPKR